MGDIIECCHTCYSRYWMYSDTEYMCWVDKKVHAYNDYCSEYKNDIETCNRIVESIREDKWKGVGDLRGSNVHHAKLTEDDVREIRRLSSNGISIITIAEQFPVSHSTVRAVVKRQSWIHVE